MVRGYLFQLRRGWKDDSTGRDDWATYENTAGHKLPLAGELVLEYDNGVPRLKIGDGEHEFSALPYMSVDSFILPKPVSVTLYSDKWEQVTDIDGADVVDTYYQAVTVNNATITSNSKIDLQPNTEQLLDFYDAGIALTTENDEGNVGVYVVGGRPTKSYDIQATVTEVSLDSEVTTDG